MSAYEKMKDVLKVARDIQNLELLKQLNELQNEVFELDTLNRDLRTRVTELEDELSLREHLVFDSNMYWRTTGAGREGPYCPRCFDSEHVPKRMLTAAKGHAYGCPSCRLALGKDGKTLRGAVLYDVLRSLATFGEVKGT